MLGALLAYRHCLKQREYNYTRVHHGLDDEEQEFKKTLESQVGREVAWGGLVSQEGCGRQGRCVVVHGWHESSDVPSPVQNELSKYWPAGQNPLAVHGWHESSDVPDPVHKDASK